MRPTAILLAIVLALAGCATVDARDWSSDANAKPFDEAAGECRGQRLNGSDPKQGEAAFTLCMNEKGWTKR